MTSIFLHGPGALAIGAPPIISVKRVAHHRADAMEHVADPRGEPAGRWQCPGPASVLLIKFWSTGRRYQRPRPAYGRDWQRTCLRCPMRKKSTYPSSNIETDGTPMQRPISHGRRDA